MANLRSLAKDTAIYGMSSIIGRFLNYLLVPIYTFSMPASSGDYGIQTNIYAYVALMLPILTFGMETTFFRFANKEGEDPKRVYSTVLYMVGGVCLAFVLFVLAFINPISEWMHYEGHSEYIWPMAIVAALDAFQCIPFAYLRYSRKALKFAMLKCLFIVLNIVLNLMYFIAVPMLYENESTRHIVSSFFDGQVRVEWIFYINLICTSLVTFFFRKELTGFKYVFDARLAKRMLNYSWPILVFGIAGILNQTADKLIFPFVSSHAGKEVNVQLGIYGACVKIAMIMTLFTQAFRYAYEPFVFGKSKEKNSRETYAAAMKYFLIFAILAFLIVCGYLDIIKRIVIAPDYWEGLKVTPIVMLSGILLGTYFNLSMWYKLIDKTWFGMIFSIAGCAVLIAVNIIFIPKYSYMACAWGGVAGYGTATILSYIFERKYYPIPYQKGRIFSYALLAAVLFGAMQAIPELLPGMHPAVYICANTVLIIIYIAYMSKKDFPLKNLPVVGKYFR